jgi:succinyl-diaminopimelate desuccinylase
MQKVIDLTKDLIRFKTMHSQPAQIACCMDFIEDYLRRFDIQYQRMTFGNSPSILALPKPAATPLLLMTHIDVVDGAEALFDPVERDGQLYGRGSLDDKYAAALSLVLLSERLSALKRAGGLQKDSSFGILITSDEEIGGDNGARQVLAEVKADFCIALDGGSLNQIVIKEKGVLTLKLISSGVAAHGATGWLGQNAIEGLVADIARIKRFFRKNTTDHWHRTLNLSLINGGKSHNQVPDRAEAILDIRYTENDDIERLLERMQARIQGRLEVERKEPMFVGAPSPYLDLLLEECPSCRLGFEHGASDARFLCDHGIAGIVWGAGGNNSEHSVDEHVAIESVGLLYNRLRNFIRRLESGPRPV